jgi:phospholipid/cholesterol/gamma-HCH transport system substrate-binding protein
MTTTWGKIAVLSVTLVLAVIYLGYLFGKAGVNPPFSGAGQYQISFETKDVDNAISPGDVKIAGVEVGAVSSVQPGNGKATVVMDLDPQAKPLHQGATVRVGAKSIAGETYMDIQDGRGAPLASGTRLPDSAIQRGVQLSDVEKSLDPKTRASLSSLLRTTGAGTAGSRQDISRAMTGLGDLGREGYTAIDAISAQSKDLTTLAHQTTGVLGALDTNQGQIATLVDKTGKLTSATSGQQRALADTVRKLPGVLTSTQQATGKLSQLSTALGPVAANLRSSAPDLSNALRQLPATSRDLRGLLPDLNGTLSESPGTLNRVPRLAQETSALVPQARQMMTQLNPMLAYLSPYGPELGAFFANFSSIFNYVDEAGTHFFRLEPDVNEGMVKGLPLKLPGILTNHNPYPAPGQSMSQQGRDFSKLQPQPN